MELAVEQPFKFLCDLTVDTIDQEVLELRAELQAEEDMLDKDEDKDTDFYNIKENIDKENEAVETGGVGETALVGVSSIVRDAHCLSDHIQLESNKLQGFQHSLIKARTALWTWIEGPVAEEAYSTAMKGRPGGDSARQTWVLKLANQVVNMLVGKQQKRTFRSKDYRLKWKKEATIVNGHWRRNMLRGQDKTIKEAVAMVVSIVETWVDAKNVCDKKQAWFASVVKEVMGEEALTMNLFWKFYQDIKPAHIILGDKGYRNPTKKDVKQFQTSLENHSVTEQDHREGQLFDLYKQLLNQEITPRAVVKELPSVSPTWLSLVEMIQIATMFDNDQQPSEPNRYLKKLQDDPQSYHPLRKRTSSRQKCRRELTDCPGPFTRAAMFSLLVWRSYPQAFLWHPDRSMLYTLPGSFLQAYKSITKTSPSELIEKSVNRTWSSLKEAKLQCITSSYPSFDKCYQHFRPSGSLETRVFPGLSQTATFDMVCDLVYVGICRPPTTADVAKYIVHMNQGSMAGLKVLGLMDSKKLDIDTKRQHVHQALVDL